MFEYHAWITVQFSAGDEDEAELIPVRQAVSDALREISILPGMVDMRIVNGMTHVHVSGFLNHRGGQGELIIDLFRRIGGIAPGSYGALYFRDDEDVNGRMNEFQILAMRRGETVESRDDLLSPCVPLIEDP